MSNTTQTLETEIPKGFMLNEKGHYVPVKCIEPIDLLRHEQVTKMVNVARRLHQSNKNDKQTLFTDVRDFFDLSAAEYDTEFRSQKGNITLKTFDHKLMVKIAVKDTIAFDERLQVAHELIKQCISEWSENTNINILVLVNEAFQVDKEGKVSTGRVIGLRRHNFQHPKWEKAMQAIADATHTTGSKEYMRFYERDDNGEYHQIPLDFSKL